MVNFFAAIRKPTSSISERPQWIDLANIRTAGIVLLAKVLMQRICCTQAHKKRINYGSIYRLCFGCLPSEPSNIFCEMQSVMLQALCLVQRDNIKMIPHVVRMLLSLEPR